MMTEQEALEEIERKRDRPKWTVIEYLVFQGFTHKKAKELYKQKIST